MLPLSAPSLFLPARPHLRRFPYYHETPAGPVYFPVFGAAKSLDLSLSLSIHCISSPPLLSLSLSFFTLPSVSPPPRYGVDPPVESVRSHPPVESGFLCHKEWLVREFRRNCRTFRGIRQHHVVLVQLEKTSSTGKQQSWALQTAHILGVYSLSRFIFLRTIHSSLQRSTFRQRSITQTSIPMAAFAWIF